MSLFFRTKIFTFIYHLHCSNCLNFWYENKSDEVNLEIGVSCNRIGEDGCCSIYAIVVLVSSDLKYLSEIRGVQGSLGNQFEQLF